jgi:hypothetical protein
MEDISYVRRTRERILVNTQGEKNHAKREERDVRENLQNQGRYKMSSLH